MSVANSASVVGERESLLSLGLPWRSYVARLECQGQGADTALEAALRELGPEEGRDPAATRVVILTRAHLQSVVNAHKLRGKVPLVEGLLKQIELDKQLGLGARADAAEAAAAAQLEREQAAEKRRKKRHRHGDGHDDDDDDARPDDDAAPAAPRTAPDAVYILRDYPATLEEASDLVKHCTKEGAPRPLLDAVVTVVANDDGGPGGGVTWPVPARPCMAFDFLPLAGDLAFGDAAAEDEASAASASAKKKKKAKKAKKKPPPEKPADPPPDDHGAPPAEVAETLEQTSVVTAEPSVEDSASAASPARDAAAAAPPPANRAQAVKLDVARALRASTEQSHRRALGAAAGKPKATPPDLVGALFDASRKQGGVWGDVTFNEVALDTVGGDGGGKKPPLGGPDDAPPAPGAWLAALTDHLFAEGGAKCAFKDWVDQVEVVPVPVDADAAAGCRAACAAALAGATGRDSLYRAPAKNGRRGDPGPWASHGRRQRYAELAAEIPEAACSPGVLVYCLVEAVCAAGDAPRPDDAGPPPSALAALLPHAARALPGWAGDYAAAEAALAGDFGAAQVTLDHHDAAGARVARAELGRVAGDGNDGARLGSRLLLALERAAHAHMQQPRLLGRAALPPPDADGPRRRGVARSELQAFTAFSPRDVDTFRQRAELEALLDGAFVRESVDATAPWDLAGREATEKLPPHAVPQVFAAEMANEPAVLAGYYAPTDELLLVLHQPTARGRCGQQLWDAAACVGARPTYARWAADAPRDGAGRVRVGDEASFFSPRTLDAQTARVDLYGDELGDLATATTLLFPADHSIVRLRTMGDKHAWLSVRKGGAVFGLRAKDGGRAAARRARGLPADGADDDASARTADSAASRAPKKPKKGAAAAAPAAAPPAERQPFAADFCCDLPDGSRCTAARGGGAAGAPIVVLTCTEPGGLTTDVGTDGVVRLRHVGVAHAGAPRASDDELDRCVVGRGTVVRRMRDGSQRLLFADGSAATRPPPPPPPPPEDPKKAKRRSKGDGVPRDEPPPDPSQTLAWARHGGAPARDPETGALVWVRGTSLLVKFADGATLARHDDGTTIRVAPDGAVVLVEAPGFAAVEVDVAIDATAHAHASGVPVPIAKGGERVRVRVALPDGGRVATTYDTSVTATVRGRLALLRPDCTEVVADDAGCCVFRPPELWSGGSIKVRGEKFVYGSRAPRAEGAEEVDEEDETRSEPDATCGAFVFDCVGGALRVEDPEFNCFAAHLCGPRAGEVELELAGVSEGIRAEAVVNSPLSPRCFVVARDGSAEELLRAGDVAAADRDASFCVQINR